MLLFVIAIKVIVYNLTFTSARIMYLISTIMVIKVLKFDEH